MKIILDYETPGRELLLSTLCAGQSKTHQRATRGLIVSLSAGGTLPTRNPNQRFGAIVVLTMLARVFSGCCEGAQRVKFRSSIGAG